MNLPKLILIAALLASSAWAQQPPAPQPVNSLTAEEQREGFVLLFNGKNGAGWHSLRKDTFPATGWVVEDGELRKVANVRGGDLLSEKLYREFDLRWDWKIAPGGNNGVKYFVTPERGSVGHEYQMLDDPTQAEGRNNGKHSTASFYDVLPPFPEKVAALKPAGEWNSSRILARGGHVEHWLNGQKVFEYELGSQAVKDAVAKSKFKSVPQFGESVKGHILLTDHNDGTAFRSIRILDLAKD